MMDLTRIQGAEELEIHTQTEQNEMLRALDFETAWLNALFRTLQDTTLAIMTVILLVGGGMAAINQSVSLGDLFTFYVVFMYARKYLLEIFNFVPSLVNGNEALERIYEIVGVEDAKPYSGGVRELSNFDIELAGVSFSYDEEPLLENINLTIKEGEFVVFEGENGSGKTTLIYLILGFYRPHNGELFLGGIPYDQLDITYIRRDMGVVLQESPVFRGSILDNITYGRMDLDETVVQEAIRLSGVDRFVDALPDGLHTEVGDEGMLLSGGQRQRIAIARALCARPRILILDEPTNHLDRRTVHDLVENLKDLPHSPTIIMINHMDQFSASADKVIRLDEKGMANVSPVSTN
jgi:ATP-binding cassette subfamily B protein